MIATNKKSKYSNFWTLINIIAMFLLLLVWFCPEKSHAQAAAYTNIGVCVQPPDPNLTNPASPIINYLITINPGNPRNATSSPFRYHQIQISKDPSFSPILHDTGIKAYQSTFSYNRGSSSDIQPTPRPACDTDSTNVNCPVSFSASSGDPAACYDWYAYQSLIGYGEPCGDSGNDMANCWADGCGAVWIGGGEGGYYICWCCTPLYQNNNASYQYNKVENPTAMPVGTYSYTVPPGTLPIDNSTYYYRVRVKDAYDWSPYAVGSFFLGATDGVCGTGLSFCDGTTITPATPGLCAPGNPLISSPTNPWAWTCDGLYGGNPSPPCSASVAPVPDLTNCGTITICSGGGALACQPGMCTGGTNCGSPIDSDSWTCSNSCGSVECPANVLPVEDGQCGTSDGEPICDGRTLTGAELCAGGSPSPSNPDTTGYEASWDCLGSCGGNPVDSCSASGKKSCGWIETNP
ncbi:MAG: hypothetical protein QMD77_00775 [Patescibacteria group bacterium]|nr:hypothetical protein [Patescibacteria group bacterium]